MLRSSALRCYGCYTEVLAQTEAVMTERLAHRDLRNRSAEVLRAVRNGARYEITNHGEVVAVLSPAGSRDPLPLRTRRAPQRGGFSALRRVRLDRPAQEALDELRHER